MTENILQIPCQKIISGGQTGVDRAALDACLLQNFHCGGWCPKERTAEDGPIPEKYPLMELPQSEYHFRTKQNVLDSDGTLIISPLPLTGGSLKTKRFALEAKKPFLIVSAYSNITPIIKWIIDNHINILNIAGPRQSEWNKAYKITFLLTSTLIHTFKL